jgi:hypothetical protein
MNETKKEEVSVVGWFVMFLFFTAICVGGNEVGSVLL